MEGGPIISKLGHVTFFRPVHGVAGDLIFGFLDPDLPIHYTAFVELRWRFRVAYRPASPLLRCFSAGFFVQNLAGSRDLCIGGRRWPHIWIPWPRLAYSLYNFHWATMTIKGSLQASIPIVKAFLTRNFQSRRKLAKNLRFLRKWGRNVKFCFRHPQKAHPCAKPRHLTYWSWKSV